MTHQPYRPATTATAWVLTNLNLSSPYGRQALKELRPAGAKDRAGLEAHFDELARLIDFCRNNKDFSRQAHEIFRQLRNISGSVASLGEDHIADEIELFEIKLFSIHFCNLTRLVRTAGLDLSLVFDDLHGLVKLLNPDEMTVTSFHLHDNYSEELKEVRAEKRQLEKQILAAVDQAKSELLRQQRGDFVRREKELEYQVRSWLSRQLKTWLIQLKRSMQTVGRLELLLAKAETALKWPACRPRLVEATAPMQLVAAVNPQMYEILKTQGKEFTPVTLEVKKGTTLITGANMGGKSVALMTIATMAELVRLGFFAFAEQCSIPLFNQVLHVAGDGQDQTSGLSSFGAEVMQLKELCALPADGSGLAVFDEFARSTNPYEGRRFVQALAEFMQQIGWHGVIATHYDGIVLSSAAFYQVIGLQNKNLTLPETSNMSDLIDNLCANMDYRLRKVDGQSNVPHDALHIATLLDADPRFLDLLKKLYH